MTATEYKAGSNLEKILSTGTFVVTGECGPPKSADGSVIEEKAKLLKGYVDAVLLGGVARRHGADADHAGLVVGDVDGVDVALEELRLLFDDAAVGALGRAALAGDHKRARGEDLLEVAACLVLSGGHTGFASSRTILRGPPELLLLQFFGGRLTNISSSRHGRPARP